MSFYCEAKSLGKAFHTGDSRCAVQCDYCARRVPKEAETTPKVEVPMPDKVAEHESDSQIEAHLEAANRLLVRAKTEPAHSPTEDALIDCLDHLLTHLMEEK